MTGKLIVFEGIDGCGKGTQISLLRKKIAEEYPENIGSFVWYKQPGTTPVGEEIRRILFETVKTHNIDEDAISLLFLVSHIEGCRKVVIPSLKKGKIVIADRWSPYSDEVFGNFGLKRPVCKEVVKLRESLKIVDPDLIVFLDGEVKSLLSRALSRLGETHQKSKAWANENTLNLIRNDYHRLFSGNGRVFTCMTDNKNAEEIFANSIWPKVKSVLELEDYNGRF